MIAQIRIHPAILRAMLEHARAAPALECCGLLAGRDGVIAAIFPAQNALASPTAYEIAPREIFRLLRRMRDENLDHMGIYHSHPTGQNAPSPTDIAQAYYPETAYFIISPRPNALNPVRAFSIQDGGVEELTIAPEES
jgi:proteasome lid subunit RPN8/RPN11